MIIRKSELIANKWSGGTTTELFIYPENSNYVSRDFDYRISTATVETDRSEFTDLTGYQRILCVLSGELTMEYHTDSGKPTTVELLPLEQVSFPGDLKVVGFGKVTDFNIIYKPEYNASAEIIRYAENEAQELTSKGERYFIWVIEGELLTPSGYCKTDEFCAVETNSTTAIRAMVNSTIILIKVCQDIFKRKV
ncbi:MAG: HutD family protein [Fluviicola sp.]|nr:HutD family protein [Fluviicola sp.]